MAETEVRAATPGAAVQENRLTAIRTRVRSLPGGFLTWRIAVTVLGVAVIIGGVILLPLPGPGWLIIFAGLGVLATEYDWAKRLLRFGRAQLARWTSWIAAAPRWMQGAVGLAGLVFLAAVFYVVYLLLYS